MIQKKKFSEAIAANISVVEGLLKTESFANSVYQNFGGNSYVKEIGVKESAWLRIMKMDKGISFLLNISRSWAVGQPSPVLFYIGYGTDAFVKQLAGSFSANNISKVRIAKYADGNTYFEEYYSHTYSSGSNCIENSISCMCLQKISEYIGSIVTEEPTNVLVETEVVDMN